MPDWVIVVWRQFSFLSAILWREQVNFQWNDDEVRFVLHQRAELDFYSASSLKQQSAGRHVATFGHITCILIPSQPVFAPSPYCCVLSEKTTNTNFILQSLVWLDRGWNQRSTAFEVNTPQTITPPMWLVHQFLKIS